VCCWTRNSLFVEQKVLYLLWGQKFTQEPILKYRTIFPFISHTISILKTILFRFHEANNDYYLSPFVRMEQSDTWWTDFSEISYL